MLRYLRDPANAITAGGLLCSALALYLALAGYLTCVSVALGRAGRPSRRYRRPNLQPNPTWPGKSLDGSPTSSMVYLPASSSPSWPRRTVVGHRHDVAAVCADWAFFAISIAERRPVLGVPILRHPLLALFFLLRLMRRQHPYVGIGGFLILAVLHVLYPRQGPEWRGCKPPSLFAVVSVCFSSV